MPSRDPYYFTLSSRNTAYLSGFLTAIHLINFTLLKFGMQIGLHVGTRASDYPSPSADPLMFLSIQHRIKADSSGYHFFATCYILLGTTLGLSEYFTFSILALSFVTQIAVNWPSVVKRIFISELHRRRAATLLLTMWMLSIASTHAQSCSNQELGHARYYLAAASLPSGLVFFGGGHNGATPSGVRISARCVDLLVAVFCCI